MAVGDAHNMTVSWRRRLRTVFPCAGVGSMLMVLLGAGIGLLLVGIAALGYGIPIKEFGLGNTLMVAGAVAACSGLLWLASGPRARIAGHVAAARCRRRCRAAVSASHGADACAGIWRHHRCAIVPAADMAAAADPDAPPPWVEDRGHADAPPAATGRSCSAGKPRRNLLFSSSSRKERERAASRASEPLAPDLLSADLRPNPPEAPMRCRTEPHCAAGNFDDAWPKSDRARPGEAPPRRSPRAPSTFNEAGSTSGPREDTPQVTVLKSGVVDGMAYSLYSDGSIEAQMPEGMMRFASIDELRSHLDQRP